MLFCDFITLEIRKINCQLTKWPQSQIYRIVFFVKWYNGWVRKFRCFLIRSYVLRWFPASPTGYPRWGSVSLWQKLTAINFSILFNFYDQHGHKITTVSIDSYCNGYRCRLGSLVVFYKECIHGIIEQVQWSRFLSVFQKMHQSQSINQQLIKKNWEVPMYFTLIYRFSKLITCLTHDNYHPCPLFHNFKSLNL